MWNNPFYEYFSFIPKFKEDYPDGRYIPKRSQKIKNKRLRAKNKRRKK